MEYLTELHWILAAVNDQEPSHIDDQACDAGGGWLGVSCRDFMLDRLERQTRQLLNDRRCALECCAFEGEHRSISIESFQSRTVAIEGAVVEIGELGRNGVDVCHFSGNREPAIPCLPILPFGC